MEEPDSNCLTTQKDSISLQLCWELRSSPVGGTTGRWKWGRRRSGKWVFARTL
ncbi:hypothetical protein LEMLEM_LOCUS15396 [Lemmus lemmus]